MLTAALPLPVVPAAPASPTPEAPGAPPSEPGAFARELQQARGDEPAPRNETRADSREDAPAEPADEPDADDPAPASAARSLREWMLHPLRRDATGPRPAGTGPAADPSLDAEAMPAAEATELRGARPDDTNPSLTPDPSLLAPWLHAPRTPVPPAAGGVAARAGDEGLATVAPAAATGGPVPDADAGPLPAASAHAERPDRRLHGGADAADPRAAGSRTALPAGAEAPTADTSPLAAAAAGTARPAEAAATPQPAPAFAAELQRATQALQPEPGAPAPREVRLGSPVTTPEFVPSLSAEVALLARDGVQEARLQLNPAELGPVAVRITVDGDRAQVHLAVDHATTLQVLDQALPSLAAALRDQGLTLSGGGVFQQSRQQNARDEGNPGAQPPWMRGRTGADEPAAEPAAVRRVVHRGGLDVYA